MKRHIKHLDEIGLTLDDAIDTMIANVIEAFNSPSQSKEYKELFSMYPDSIDVLKATKEAIKHNPELNTDIEKIIVDSLNKEIDKSNISNMATGSVIHSIQEIITAGGREGIQELPERKKQINHSGKYSIAKGDILNNEQGMTVIRHDLSDKRSYLRFLIPDNIIDEKLGYGIYTKKIFLFLLEKINQQVYHDGQIMKDFIVFPVQELIERGLYKTPQSARKGFLDAMNILTSIKLQGEIWYTARKCVSVVDLTVIFPKARYESYSQQCKVFLSPWIKNWDFIYQAFSILPDYYYELSSKPSELVYYIFYIARQHTQDIKERRRFTIGFRAIQQALHLPSEKKTKNPQRDILDVINNAIDCIDKAQVKYFESEDLLFLSAEYNDNANIAEILNDGKLHVHLTGEFAAPFIEVATNRKKKLDQIKKATERRRNKDLNKL